MTNDIPCKKRDKSTLIQDSKQKNERKTQTNRIKHEPVRENTRTFNKNKSVLFKTYIIYEMENRKKKKEI